MKCPFVADSSFCPAFFFRPVAGYHLLLRSMFTAGGEVLQRHVQYQAHISDLRGGQVFQNGDEIH
jgi:hypothetical protein